MFIKDVRQWSTDKEFHKYLDGYNPNIAHWARGIVIHHTWAPTIEQWRGRRSIESIARYYEQRLCWDRGPHLFIAAGSPNADDDGIWQMTPMNVRGIHAGSANSWAWGIEVVGNYDLAPWPASLEERITNTVLSLLDWRGITATAKNVIGHREVPSPKTCPGRMINMNTFRSKIIELQVRNDAKP